MATGALVALTWALIAAVGAMGGIAFVMGMQSA